MTKVRERAWVERLHDGSYRMRTNSGSVGVSSFDLESVQKSVDYINNEDSDGHYFEVADNSSNMVDEEWEREEKERREKRERERKERAIIRIEKKKQKIENNRKSKRSNETYFYIVSMIERGSNAQTVYFSGETNLLTMKRFTVGDVKKSKVFNTKASAQKVVDIFENNRIIYKLYRNIKVVQKKRELFD